MSSEMKCRAGGFTLIEMLVGLSIAAIAFSGIYSLNVQSIKIIKAAQNESRLVQIAGYEMERLRSMPWDDVEDLGTSYVITTSNPAYKQISCDSAMVYLAGNSVTQLVTVVAKGVGASSRTNVVSMSVISENGFLR